jgi:hypothetical protein
VAVAAFQYVEQMSFDLGCDVAVGLDEAVGQVVAQSSGLGDLGDVLGDQPGLVRVA